MLPGQTSSKPSLLQSTLQKFDPPKIVQPKVLFPAFGVLTVACCRCAGPQLALPDAAHATLPGVSHILRRPLPPAAHPATRSCSCCRLRPTMPALRLQPGWRSTPCSAGQAPSLRLRSTLLCCHTSQTVSSCRSGRACHVRWSVMPQSPEGKGSFWWRCVTCKSEPLMRCK